MHQLTITAINTYQTLLAFSTSEMIKYLSSLGRGGVYANEKSGRVRSVQKLATVRGFVVEAGSTVQGQQGLYNADHMCHISVA